MLTGAPELRSLPAGAAELVHGIDTGTVLGASRQLSVLGDALLDIAVQRRGDPTRLRADVTALTEHVSRTRGASSRAVDNGMSLMTGALLAMPEASDDSQRLTTGVEAFRADLARWLEEVRRHGTHLLSGAGVVLAYDYSSTVAQVLGELAAGGQGLRVLVPEARSLDGGLKYLPDWQALGMTVHLVPDSAISWALAGCDAVVVGAETLSAAGGCYNTVGTATTAREAGRAGVPFHVLSVLLKTDLAPSSAERPVPSMDFLDRLGVRAPAGAGGCMTLRGDFPDLDYTPPGEVTSVVTERGVLAPDDVAAAARRTLVPEAARD